MSRPKMTNTEKELARFFRNVIKESRANLKSKGAIASKDLYRSLKSKVKENPNSISAEVMAEDYWKFINYGVKGVKSGKSLKNYRYTNKKPPVRFLRTWLKYKIGTYRPRQLNSMAFRVQNTIYQRGIKPTEFFTKPFEEEFKKLPDDLVEAYGLDVDDFLNFVFKDGK